MLVTLNDLALFFSSMVKAPPLPYISEDDTATLFYTSGTTGMPKGVSFNHRDIVFHAFSIANTVSDYPISLGSGDTLMPLVPMFHVHAWGLPQLFLLKGLTIERGERNERCCFR